MPDAGGGWPKLGRAGYCWLRAVVDRAQLVQAAHKALVGQLAQRGWALAAEAVAPADDLERASENQIHQQGGIAVVVQDVQPAVACAAQGLQVVGLAELAVARLAEPARLVLAHHAHQREGDDVCPHVEL